ncbi:hypothetical protein ABIB85_000596 [Bradyrhizobium sp. JR1.5]
MPLSAQSGLMQLKPDCAARGRYTGGGLRSVKAVRWCQ